MWIDPNAPTVALPPGLPPNERRPICIERTSGGFVVRMNSGARSVIEHFESCPLHEKYEGFFPALKVD